MNLPPNPMRDVIPLDANAIHREKGAAALRDILDVAPAPIKVRVVKQVRGQIWP